MSRSSAPAGRRQAVAKLERDAEKQGGGVTSQRGLAVVDMLLQRYGMVSELVALEDIRRAVGRVCDGFPIARLDLFGSRATGTSKVSSDVDLLFEFDDDAKMGLFALGAIREDLVERLGVEVDILSRKAVAHSHNIIRRESILGHTVPLYARGLVTF